MRGSFLYSYRIFRLTLLFLFAGLTLMHRCAVCFTLFFSFLFPLVSAQRPEHHENDVHQGCSNADLNHMSAVIDMTEILCKKQHTDHEDPKI